MNKGPDIATFRNHQENFVPFPIPSKDQILWEVIKAGDFQSHGIQLPELPVFDGSSLPALPSKFPVSGAKFGESKKPGFDHIILPPWVKYIHDNRLFLRFLLLEVGYQEGNIRSIREVSTTTGLTFDDIMALTLNLIALKGNRRNTPMTPQELIAHLSQLLEQRGVLTLPFASRSIISPEKIRYFQTAKRIQGDDYQVLLYLHRLLYQFRPK